jgi:hypothetical protein
VTSFRSRVPAVVTRGTDAPSWPLTSSFSVVSRLGEETTKQGSAPINPLLLSGYVARRFVGSSLGLTQQVRPIWRRGGHGSRLRTTSCARGQANNSCASGSADRGRVGWRTVQTGHLTGM